jgi:hypothetical protein
MTGDTKGAIADFQAFIAWKNASEKKFPEDKQNIILRQRWIDSLGIGKNPFTPQEIKTLLNNN